MTRSPSKTPNPLLSAALGYAERGWRVFPLHPRNKTPIPREGFKEATTSRHEVLRWWQLFPDANIGLATGDPFDVLDLDNFSDEVVSALSVPLGSSYRHDGPVAHTGKGAHYYFAASGNRNRAGLLDAQIDFRGDGGYVVAPPSIHPSGATYRWAAGRGPEHPLPLVPPALANILVRQHRPAAPNAVRQALPRGERVAASSVGAFRASRPDIRQVVEEELGREVFVKGANYVINCLFHHDPGPSMVLYTDDNSFHCFGCEATGDSYNLRAGKDARGKPAVF